MGLGDLFGWVPQLFTWLLGWVPHWGRVHAYAAGVKISGPVVRELTSSARLLGIGPRGVFLYVPHFSEVFTDNVVRKVIELGEQLLTTGDGLRVRAGAVMEYAIVDIVTWLAENEDPEHAIQVAAARVFREWLRTRTFAEVQQHRAGKRGDEDALTSMADDELGEPFGVHVRQLALASFAETDARALHHTGALTGKTDPTSVVRLD